MTARAVPAVATVGGRQRWCLENQGFNVPTNSGRNLAHACSAGAHGAAYYYRLPIAPVLLRLLEKGRLLRRLAPEQGQGSARALLGRRKDRAARLLESLRDLRWPAARFAPARRQIRFDSS